MGLMGRVVSEPDKLEQSELNYCPYLSEYVIAICSVRTQLCIEVHYSVSTVSF